MVNQVAVRNATEKILDKGLYPKTGQLYLLDDITNADYRQAVEDYILEQTEGI
ncbi:hypothetical protein NST33_06140 [Paenibacillus sp. FSL L8-0435]|uniref:hypothetical protein n=1 Tax=Paenibacillus TaxID=44249 RepID=UPI001C8DAE25|nr:hypothetical protein [Paenibacillus xylanexedens]MBY0114995.1 hypothetical protein [Paenibacillus xylanexedens]